MARVHLINPDIDWRLAPVCPHSGAQLHLSTGTVTSNIKRTVIQPSRGPALLKHIQVLNTWDHETAEQVDWTSHGIAL